MSRVFLIPGAMSHRPTHQSSCSLRWPTCLALSLWRGPYSGNALAKDALLDVVVVHVPASSAEDCMRSVPQYGDCASNFIRVATRLMRGNA